MYEGTNTSLFIDEAIDLLSVIYNEEASVSNITITKTEAKQRLGSLRELKRKNEHAPSLVNNVDIPPNFLNRLVENCPRLRDLDLCQTSCSDLTPLSEIRSLRSLKLDDTLVHDLSPLKEAKRLCSLSIGNTQIQDFNPIKDLTGLCDLSLNNTPIRDLTVLTELPGLQSLSLNNTNIPDMLSLKELKGLQSLSLDGTQIQDITVLAELPNLQSLSLNNTNIQDMLSLKELKGLQSLSLDGTQIQDLSIVLELTSLSALSLKNNLIQDLSPLMQLSRLHFLELSDNRINDIAPLRGLVELQLLKLDNNQIHDIAPLNRIKGLRILGLSNNQIQDLTPLHGMTRLQVLELSNNQIQDLTPLHGMTRLQLLELSNNLVHDIAPLERLKALVFLSVNDNQIQDIQHLKGITSLELLDLSNNQIQDLTPLTGMGGLLYLSLGNTFVRKIEPVVWMNNLQTLDLHNTQVTSLDPLSSLTKLRHLILDGLRLDNIPRFCFREGLQLSLENTSFASQPAALFRLPREEILRTYYDVRKVKINEGKVIFLGDSGVGKTHTILRIQAQGEKNNYKTDSTPGVDIKFFCSGDGVRIRFWDFGGQEIMQSMHQCFLTERTCYVIVISNRDPGQAMHQARKWLRTVAGFTNGVSVILAVNQWHNVSAERNIDPSELRTLCPTLNKIVFYSALDDSQKDFNKRITATIQEEVLNLDSIKLALPISWAAIREELLALPHNYITMSNYRKICATHGLSGTDNATEEICMWLLDWFNDMGICFSYHPRSLNNERTLKDYKVLQPQWLTNAIYRIINNGLNLSTSGILSTEDLYLLINSRDYVSVSQDIRYTQKDINYILEVMRRFNRSFPVGKGLEFIPETLPGRKPEKVVPRDIGTPLIYKLQLTYLPVNLLHRLMIALHRWNDGIIWRTGARFLDNSSIMVVEALSDTQTILIELYLNHNKPAFCNLFHEARGQLLRMCDEMRLVVESEKLCLERDGAVAEYELQTLVAAFARTDDALSFALPSTGGRFQMFSLHDLLLPFFPYELLAVAKQLSNGKEQVLGEIINVVSKVYPFATKETIQLVKKRIRFSGASEIISKRQSRILYSRLQLVDPDKLSLSARLDILTAFSIDNASFFDWLIQNGVKLSAATSQEHSLLEKNLISGTNRDLFIWAEDSALYHRAVFKFDPDLSLLAKALGPNEQERYYASAELITAIWHAHPELGLAPDYMLLSNLQKDNYSRTYEDMTTHMFKVFLLGLFLYDNCEKIRLAVDIACADPNSFLSIWIIASLYLDAGLLFERRKKIENTEFAHSMYDYLASVFSTPLTRLYPDDFRPSVESELQRQSGIYFNSNNMYQTLMETVAALNSIRPQILPSYKYDANLIEAYYSSPTKLQNTGFYNDHGILSAFLLLCVKNGLCRYMDCIKNSSLSNNQQKKVNEFHNFAPQYQHYVQTAAEAIALHNLKKDSSTLEVGVATADFQISLKKQPIAYLLRLCDELHCWDRQQFSGPADYVSGDKMKFNTDAGRVSLSFPDSSIKLRKRIKSAVRGYFDPPAEECVELV